MIFQCQATARVRCLTLIWRQRSLFLGGGFVMSLPLEQFGELHLELLTGPCPFAALTQVADGAVVYVEGVGVPRHLLAAVVVITTHKKGLATHEPISYAIWVCVQDRVLPLVGEDRSIVVDDVPVRVFPAREVVDVGS